ncbi:MAG: c-type cytochrome [Actinobacteria bacterium]|nr:c-type cytochrome [Actinomycetota bacterium]
MRLIAVAIAVASLVVACSESPSPPPRTVTGGDPDRGLAAIEDHGCVSCHVVPGASGGASAWVGPPLTKYAHRSYVAGVLVNNEENLVRWIMDPKSVNRRTAMPDLDVSSSEARDIAAYLYSLH